jgi:hypothetical protein
VRIRHCTDVIVSERGVRFSSVPSLLRAGWETPHAIPASLLRLTTSLPSSPKLSNHGTVSEQRVT